MQSICTSGDNPSGYGNTWVAVVVSLLMAPGGLGAQESVPVPT